MSHTSLWEVAADTRNHEKTILVTGGSGLVGKLVSFDLDTIQYVWFVGV